MAGGFREDRRHRQLAVGEHLADRRQADRANASPSIKPTRGQLRYLRRGLGQPAGKLPLFDEVGGAGRQEAGARDSADVVAGTANSLQSRCDAAR